MGELTASLAHEIRQPIAAALTKRQYLLCRWLGRRISPEYHRGARSKPAEIIKRCNRATENYQPGSACFFKKGVPQQESLGRKYEVIEEMIPLPSQRGEPVFDFYW